MPDEIGNAGAHGASAGDAKDEVLGELVGLQIVDGLLEYREIGARFCRAAQVPSKGKYLCCRKSRWYNHFSLRSRSYEVRTACSLGLTIDDR